MRDYIAKWWNDLCLDWECDKPAFFTTIFAAIFVYGAWGFLAWSCLNPTKPEPPDPVAESEDAAIGWWTSSWGRYELGLDAKTKGGQTVWLAVHLDHSTDPPSETKGTWRPTENGVEVELKGAGTLSLIHLPGIAFYKMMAPGEDAPISHVWFQEEPPEDDRDQFER